jgi:uncharacterized membrane protein
MAEIRVEPRKRSLAWVWVILLLIIAAGVAWYFMSSSRADVRTGSYDAPREVPTLVGAATLALAPASAPIRIS